MRRSVTCPFFRFHKAWTRSRHDCRGRAVAKVSETGRATSPGLRADLNPGQTSAALISFLQGRRSGLCQHA